MFPILIKSSTRVDIVQEVFRNLYLENEKEFLKNKQLLSNLLENSVEFIASEFVIGDDTNIYAYTCYLSQDGVVQNE